MANALEKRIAALEIVQQANDETARVLIHPASASDEEVHGMVAELRRTHPAARAVVAIPDNGRDSPPGLNTAPPAGAGATG